MNADLRDRAEDESQRHAVVVARVNKLSRKVIQLREQLEKMRLGIE